MKLWLTALLLWLVFPHPLLGPFSALCKSVASDLTSDTVSASTLLLGTGLIGLIGINRRP